MEIMWIIYNICCAKTIRLSHIHMVLNPTSVGNNFFSLAHTSMVLVTKLKKYNHQISTLNIRPGIMIIALAVHASASTML